MSSKSLSGDYSGPEWSPAAERGRKFAQMVDEELLKIQDLVWAGEVKDAWSRLEWLRDVAKGML